MSKERIHLTKLREQMYFLNDFNFSYTYEYVQMLMKQIHLRDARIHELEHALMSYRDFIKDPAIAGIEHNAAYAEALHARARELLYEGEDV